MRKLTITVCSSANFYKKVVEIQATLEKAGHRTIIPHTAEKMKKSGDFDVSHYKTWFAEPGDYHKKAALMRTHFNEIEKGDIILVVNEEKHGQPNYIGGNVLMEMAIAFYLNKPLYILNDVPQASSFLEEILGMEPTVLNGNAQAFVEALALNQETNSRK